MNNDNGKSPFSRNDPRRGTGDHPYSYRDVLKHIDEKRPTTLTIGDAPPKRGSLAKQLLRNAAGSRGDNKPAAPDARPLIDRLHEATFTNPIGMQWYKDLYALRSIIRKAHCFTLDDDTSRMVADFSVEICGDLEGVRRLAIPPYPVTWIDVNNIARLGRMKELGHKLSENAESNPVDRVGWLIHPADIGGWYMTYVCNPDQSVMTSPLSYWWHASQARPNVEFKRAHNDDYIQGLTFGLPADRVNVEVYDAYPTITPLHTGLADIARDQTRALMGEIAGELRHVWGFLVALNATGQFGVQTRMVDQKPHTDIRTMSNGKPLIPIEHKVLTLSLRPRWSPAKSVLRAVTQAKKKEHDVRGHIRTLLNVDGSIRKLVPVRDHKRGDIRLGRVEKTYKVQS